MPADKTTNSEATGHHPNDPDPRESMAVNLYGYPCPLQSSRSYQCALVVVDGFSSIRIAPLKKDYKARDICDALTSKVFAITAYPSKSSG